MLLTSAPVAAGRIAAPALPLDLHVLSLSLAFILSQDQTLRCIYYVSSSFKEKNLKHMSRNESSCPTAQGRLLNLSSIATCKLSSWN